MLQHKGLDYHFLRRCWLWPLTGLVVLIAMRAAGAWDPRLPRYRVIMIWLLAALPLWRSFDWTVLLARRMDVPMRVFADTLRANDIGPRVAMFSTRIYLAYPLPIYRARLSRRGASRSPG